MRKGNRLTATLFLAATLASAAGDLERKIRRVENGLAAGPGRKMSIEERLKHYKVPGASVAVVRNGRMDWARGYGEMSAGSGQAVTADTLFQAASISKPVAAMVAMRLVDLGRLSLDEDVNVRLRSWKVPDNEFVRTEKVTLRRLLS